VALPAVRAPWTDVLGAGETYSRVRRTLSFWLRAWSKAAGGEADNPPPPAHPSESMMPAAVRSSVVRSAHPPAEPAAEAAAAPGAQQTRGYVR